MEDMFRASDVNDESRGLRDSGYPLAAAEGERMSCSRASGIFISVEARRCASFSEISNIQ